MTPTSKDEAMLTSAVDRMGELVADGSNPTDALVKTAGELGLLPGFMKVAADIFNSGQQVDQFQRGKTANDKLAKIPLVDSDRAIDIVYGKKEAALPTARTKVANDAFDAISLRVAPLPDVPDVFFQKAASDIPVKPEGEFFVTMKKLAQDRERVERLNVQVESSREQIAGVMLKLAEYFALPAHSRLSLATVETVSKHAFDGFDLENLFGFLADRHPMEKRAGDDKMVRGTVNLNASPFTLVRSIVADCQFMKSAIDDVEASKLRILSLEKKAGLGDVGSVTLGTALGQSVTGHQDNDDQVKSIYGDLMDPDHTMNLNGIRAKAVLSHVINDPDDPIRDVPLNKIVHKYNDIAAIAPHMARTPTTLKPILRRMLQAAPQPFELSEIAGLEKSINPSREARIKDE